MKRAFNFKDAVFLATWVLVLIAPFSSEFYLVKPMVGVSMIVNVTLLFFLGGLTLVIAFWGNKIGLIANNKT